MAVDIQRESGSVIAQVVLHGFDIVPGPEGGNGVTMPLWHNKDLQGRFLARQTPL